MVTQYIGRQDRDASLEQRESHQPTITMFLDRLQRIIVDYSPDQLFGRGTMEDAVDREATTLEYDVRLNLYLAEVFNPISVEATPVLNAGQAMHPLRTQSARPREFRLCGCCDSGCDRRALRVRRLLGRDRVIFSFIAGHAFSREYAAPSGQSQWSGRRARAFGRPSRAKGRHV